MTLRQQIDGRRHARRRAKPLDRLPNDERPAIVKRFQCRRHAGQGTGRRLSWSQVSTSDRGVTVHTFTGGRQPAQFSTPAWNWSDARKAWKDYCQANNRPLPPQTMETDK